MSETGSGTPEQANDAYFSAIETEFIRRRGTPFLLSPKDYALARRWFTLGIPIADVCVGIGEAFDRREERGAIGRVNSLSYCEGAVLEAWERRASARVGKSEASSPIEDVGARLAAMERALAIVDTRFGEAVAPVVRSLGRLGASDKTAEETERALSRLEKKLLREIEGTLTQGERDALSADVDGRLGRDAGGMEETALRRTRDVLTRQRLREVYRVPRLSLLT
jgi:hypothetical protein